MSHGLKTTFILIILILVSTLLPDVTVDPWGILNLKKLASIISALAVIQTVSRFAILKFGSRAGSFLAGFCGGLISSTATTAALARQTKKVVDESVTSEMLNYLAAVLAMLFEGIVIVWISLDVAHPILLFVFAGPIMMACFLMLLLARHPKHHHAKSASTEFKILPLITLAVFIIAVLFGSKLLQSYFGQSGIYILTFIVSLFEIHGSVIANLQLHTAGGISIRELGVLLGISIVASYVSKVFLVHTLGSPRFRNQVYLYTTMMFFSTLVSTYIFWIYSASL